MHCSGLVVLYPTGFHSKYRTSSPNGRRRNTTGDVGIQLSTPVGFYKSSSQVGCLLTHLDLDEGNNSVIQAPDATPAATLAVSSRTRANLAQEQLVTAAAAGNVELIKQLLFAGAPVNTCSDNSGIGVDGVTALHVAAARGHPDVVQVLLAAGADVHVSSAPGRTPLFMALTTAADARNRTGSVRQIAVVELLLKAGAGVFRATPRSGSNPAGILAPGKSWRLRRLLAAGCSPHIQGADGRTLLHYAAAKGNKEAVQILLDHGVAVDVTSSEGATPLFMAAAGKHAAVVQQLLGAGAAATALSTDGGTVLHWLARVRPSAKVPAAAGLDPCCPPPVVPQALQEVVQLLLSNGVDVNATDGKDATALHVAAEHDNTATVAVLLEFGASVQAADSDGLTPFHNAVFSKDVAVARLLLEAGADMNLTVFAKGRHPLQISVVQGDAAMLRLLLEFGANPNQLVTTLPILVMAVVVGHAEVVQALLDGGAETGGALIAAVQGRQLPVVQVLLSHKGSQPSLNTVVEALDKVVQQPPGADSLGLFASLLLRLCCIFPLAEAVPWAVAHAVLVNQDWDHPVLTSALLSSWGQDTAEMDAADSTLALQEKHLAAVRTAAQHVCLQVAGAQRTASSLCPA